MKDQFEMEDNILLGHQLRHEIKIDYVGSIGKKYEGRIIVKRPSIGDYLKIGALKASYIKQPVGVDPETKRPIYPDLMFIDNEIKAIAQMLATLQVVVVKAPSWFANLEKIDEFELINIIYTEYEEWLNSFRKSDIDKFEGNSKASATEDKMVDSETV